MSKRISKHYYRFKAIIESWVEGGSVIIPRSCVLSVPLSCNGSGNVTLQESVSLGFRKAPITGQGTILLQARYKESSIIIGARTRTSNNICLICCSKITVGENCKIGDQVAIYDSDFHEINPENRSTNQGVVSPVTIGNNVWLGSRVIVLKGVTIGDHSVVAAGAVVTKSIPPRSLAGGVPARVIRDI